jgi:hypothetical protein
VHYRRSFISNLGKSVMLALSIGFNVTVNH